MLVGMILMSKMLVKGIQQCGDSAERKVRAERKEEMQHTPISVGSKLTVNRASSPSHPAVTGSRERTWGDGVGGIREDVRGKNERNFQRSRQNSDE
jgi:hypothetical protein